MDLSRTSNTISWYAWQRGSCGVMSHLGVDRVRDGLWNASDTYEETSQQESQNAQWPAVCEAAESHGADHGRDGLAA